MGARLILWALVLIVFLALYGGLILKASQELRSYRPDGPRAALTTSDHEISHARSYDIGGQQ